MVVKKIINENNFFKKQINKTYGWCGKYFVLGTTWGKSIGLRIIMCKERYRGIMQKLR